MSVSLRPYQEDCCRALMTDITNHGNPILQLPTGSGKSILVADITRRCKERWGAIKILVLTHRAKLVEQDAEKFEKLGIPANVYCAGLKRKEVGQFTVGTILSVSKHAELFADTDLVIVDELQYISNEEEGSYRKFLSQLGNAKVVGLSATPYRLKGGACYGPNRLFNRIAYKIGFGDLVRQGYLTPPINYDANAEDDLKDVRITAGDYNKDDLNKHFNKIVSACCADLVKRMKDRHYVLVFACSIVHAEAIVECLKNMGEKAVVYHSELSLAEDKAVIKQFQEKQFKYLVSIDKLGVGFDAPFVDGLGLMRPTMSRALAIQQLGRGSRLYDGKENFLVADYAGNIRRHNLLDPDAYDVPIEQIKKVKRTNTDAPSKVCPNCQAICATRTTTCQCGYKFPPKLSLKADMEKQVIEDKTPVRIWRASVENNAKHDYVKLLVGGWTSCRPVFFFPEDTGYAKTKTYIGWNNIFGKHGFKLPYGITCEKMVLYLNKMKGIFTEATFVKKDKYYELTSLTKGGIDDGVSN